MNNFWKLRPISETYQTNLSQQEDNSKNMRSVYQINSKEKSQENTLLMKQISKTSPDKTKSQEEDLFNLTADSSSPTLIMKDYQLI